ncbi:MAG: hypothetical protein M3Y34_05220, partial [Actinomycetota bacterium]|nr:hypothetical protein [Actinomycetota bacterium]
MAVEQLILAVDVEMGDVTAHDSNTASGARCQRGAFPDFAATRQRCATKSISLRSAIVICSAAAASMSS